MRSVYTNLVSVHFKSQVVALTPQAAGTSTEYARETVRMRVRYEI